MASALGRATLSLYRSFRVTMAPEAAVEKLREHLRIARVYAITAGRSTHAAELTDEVSVLTGWLETARLSADRPGRVGRFWRTGRYHGPLTFLVYGKTHDGRTVKQTRCHTAGCAIKHAFGMLTDPGIDHVLVDDNRGTCGRQVTRDTTLRTVALYHWPDN